MRKRPFPALVPVTLLLIGVSLASPSGADPWITLTSCEPVEVAGKTFEKVQFSVHNAGSFGIGSIAMYTPDPHAPADSCDTIAVEGPSTWFAERGPDGGAQWGTFVGTDSQINPGATLGGFVVTVSGPACCFHFVFLNEFGDPFADTHFCLACATPAQDLTWGRSKTCIGRRQILEDSD